VEYQVEINKNPNIGKDLSEPINSDYSKFINNDWKIL
jgi:hypothetical protein